jgi:RNA polymerase sigma factor (sigma-70 family)
MSVTWRRRSWLRDNFLFCLVFILWAALCNALPRYTEIIDVGTIYLHWHHATGITTGRSDHCCDSECCCEKRGEWMEQRREAMNSTTPHLAHNDDESPLRAYLAALEGNGEGLQILNSIRLYVHKANLAGEQSAHEIALEIMQEMVMEALRSEPNFDRTASPKPWLLGIAVNLVKRRREKLFRRRQRETLAADLAQPNEVTEEELFDRLAAQVRPGPEQEVLAAMDLNEMLAQLSPAERNLIQSYLHHDMNGAEVAHALGISAGNARVRFHRVLTKLRAIGQAQQAGPPTPNPKSSGPQHGGLKKSGEEKHSYE